MSEAGAIPFSWRRALIYWPVIPNIYLICGEGVGWWSRCSSRIREWWRTIGRITRSGHWSPVAPRNTGLRSIMPVHWAAPNPRC
jgi:hypothetical protein